MSYFYTMTPVAALASIVVVLVIDILFFLWKKKIAEDILDEKGYPVGTKKIGALMFFLPVVCWIYVACLPKKDI